MLVFVDLILERGSLAQFKRLMSLHSIFGKMVFQISLEWFVFIDLGKKKRRPKRSSFVSVYFY
ncbi:hypothetical protein DLK05_09500 [Ancylomarina longa]|uniref:Uncharacterized protein n=1 Tax=Ancylomarina longa TaxID=2487017 RepID=A0A434AV22_9BACT|nr:hypothetical protein DLK05_09500 [Ancylomarina longa]